MKAVHVQKITKWLLMLSLAVLLTSAINGQHRENPFVRAGEFLIDSTLVYIPGSGTSPSVAFSGTTYIAVWTNNSTASYANITAARISQSGVLIDSAGILVSSIPAQQIDPSIAFGSTTYLIVWSDNRGGTYDIYGTRMNAAGIVLDTADILIALSSIDLLTPAVVHSGSSFFVIWKEQLSPTTGYIQGVRISEAGTIIDTIITINYQPIAFISPSLSFDGRNFFAVWAVATHLYGARVDSGGALIDTTNIQIATNPGYKTNPSLSFDGNNYLVVWQDNRNGSTDIFGARIDTGGTVLDTLARPLIVHNDNMEYPALTFTGETYLLAWQDARFAGTDIYVARVNTEGVVIDTNGVPVSAALPNEYEPALAFSGASQLLIAWSVGDSSIAGSRIDTSCALIDSISFALSVAVCPQWNPQVASNGNQYLVAWYDNRNATDLNIYGARIDTTGSVLDATMIPIATHAVNQQLPTVAGSPENYLIAWQDDRFANIYAARVDTAGSLLDPSGFPITTANHEQEAPAAIFDGTKYFVVWHDRRNASGIGIYGTGASTSGIVLNPAGIRISYISGMDERYPAIASNGQCYLIVWNRYPNGLAAAVTDTSGVVIDTVTIAHTLAADAYPCVTSDGTNFLVAWEDIRNAESDIYVTRLDSSGAILDSSGIPLCIVSGSQVHPTAVWDGTYYTVVWEDYRNTSSDIYGARVTNTGSVFNRFSVVTQDGNQFMPSIVDGAGAHLMLAYAGFADSIGTEPVNTIRIWGSLFVPPAGIAEENPKSSRSDISLHFLVNPARSKTTISYTIVQKGNVSLTIYNASGRKVKNLVHSHLRPGRYTVTWNGIDANGIPVQSAVYFCCLQIGSERYIRKVVFFR